MAPKTVVDRLIAQMADMQSRLRYLETLDPPTPSCLLRRTSNQTIPHGAGATSMIWTTETRDRSGMHDPSTNPERITALHAGLYFMISWLVWTSNSTGIRAISLYQNGVRRRMEYRNADDGQFLGVSALLLASAGDYFTVGVIQTSGGNLDVVYSAESPWFGCFKITGG